MVCSGAKPLLSPRKVALPTVLVMKQIQVVKPVRRPVRRELDLRTPAGRRLPY